jgi:hypothetical protein
MKQQHIDDMLSGIPMGVSCRSINHTLICWLGSEECSFSTGALFDIGGDRPTH